MAVLDKFIQDLARRAGKILMNRFGKAHTVRAKEHPSDVVTEADLATEKLIISAIRKKFPDHGIVSEESGTHNGGAEHVWYIDPLDGTFNFSKNSPLFCTMLGLAYKQRPLLAAIVVPRLNYFCFAKAGKGTYLNGKRAHCSTHQTFQDSFGCGPTNFRRPAMVALMGKLLKNAAQEPFWMSGLGSVGVHSVFTASGMRDWYISTKMGAHEAPTAALILREAGCVVTNAQGRPWKMGDTSIIAANKFLQPQLLRLVRGK